MSTGTNPFKSRASAPPPSMRVLHRFRKGPHIAEIRERTVTQFQAFEFYVFVDDGMQESQMFQGNNLEAYPSAIEDRVKQFLDGGWVEEHDIPLSGHA